MKADKVLYIILRRYTKKNENKVICSEDHVIWNATQSLRGKKVTKGMAQSDIMEYNLDLLANAFSYTTHFLQEAIKSSTTNEGLPPLKTCLTRLTMHSEIVIRGHGDVDNNRVSGVTGEVLARTLIAEGLKADCRINITGCNLGRNSQTPIGDVADTPAATTGTGSFAAIFQKTLWAEAGLTTVVKARTRYVGVNGDGGKDTTDTLTPINWQSKYKHSKIVFRISNSGVQTMAYDY